MVELGEEMPTRGRYHCEEMPTRGHGRTPSEGFPPLGKEYK